MFLTRNCTTHFAHGPTRPPAAWVHSKAVGTALPWAQGAASHPKQTSPKGRLWLGRCHQCPLCPARAVLACWPPRCWCECWCEFCAQLEQAASSSWPNCSPEMTHLDRACELLLGMNSCTTWAEPAHPCLQEGSLGGFERQEGKGNWSGSTELRNLSEMLMPSSDAPAL